MSGELRRIVQSTRLAAEEIGGRSRRIHEALLRESAYLDGANFECIHPDDLRRLFDAYDAAYFEGACRRALGELRLEFRLSQRMTKAAGKTTRFTPRDGSRPPFYEIAVSTALLFETFRDGDRAITVTGLPCRDRLEVLQRVVEHEMLHLVEMLVWTRSSCTGPRFQSIAHGLFGHTQHTHALITHQERAFTQHGVRPGTRVRFRLDGAEHTGFVNRVTKRATVLVEDERGAPYSDGKRYAKFYVPVEMLEVVEA